MPNSVRTRGPIHKFLESHHPFAVARLTARSETLAAEVSAATTVDPPPPLLPLWNRRRCENPAVGATPPREPPPRCLPNAASAHLPELGCGVKIGSELDILNRTCQVYVNSKQTVRLKNADWLLPMSKVLIYAASLFGTSQGGVMVEVSVR